MRIRSAARVAIARLAAASRQLWIIAAVVASVVSIPVAATCHGLQHLEDGFGTADTKHGHAKAVCEICAAFAGATHGLAGFAVPRQFADNPPPGFSPQAAGFFTAPLLSFRQRAPPFLP